MIVKPTVLAPMPSAMATTAAAENQRSFTISRTAKRRSCNEVLEGRQAACVAMLHRERRGRADRDAGGAPRLVRRHAASDVVRGQHLDVRLELLREILVRSPTFGTSRRRAPRSA